MKMRSDSNKMPDQLKSSLDQNGLLDRQENKRVTR